VAHRHHQTERAVVQSAEQSAGEGLGLGAIEISAHAF
jgi:hypothetical protein